MAKTVRFIVVFFILHHLVTDDDVTLSLPTPTKTLYPRQAMTSDYKYANLNWWRWPTLRDFNFRWVESISLSLNGNKPLSAFFSSKVKITAQQID